MFALRKMSRKVGDVTVAEVPSLTPGPKQVRVHVAYAGICGTDLHIFHGQFDKVRPPVTLGHEVAGVIDAVGEGVDSWHVGERVTVESEVSTCGQCEMCRSEVFNLCAERKGLGYSVDGGFAESIVVKESALHRLPENVSLKEGALCEPLAVAVHAVRERSSIEPGSWVLVTGPGPIGLLVLQVALSAGGRVIVTGTANDSDRLRLADTLGAESTLLVDSEDIQEGIAQITNDHGIDVAFECSGKSAAISDCLASVRSGGEIVQVGLCNKAVSVDIDQLALREIHLKGAFAHTSTTWDKAIHLVGTGEIDLNTLISGAFSIYEWEEAFRLSGAGDGVKYVLYPERQK